MFLQTIKPAKALNKAYLKEKVSREHIELLKKNLKRLFDRFNEQESEEHLKNVMAAFLRDTWYEDLFEINTKERNDLVIHTGKSTSESAGVIVEVKKPSNKAEMMSVAKPNCKALHELVLYYLRERLDYHNTDIKYLIATNIYEWFIIDEVWFEKNIFRSTKLRKDYEAWKISGNDTKFFYESIAKPHIENLSDEMTAAYFDFRDYEKYITNSNNEDDTKLISLFKILSPTHLLKQPFANDSNTLDTKFYSELLYILGLEEERKGGKKLIQRKSKPDEASLLENAIIKIEDKDCLRHVTGLTSFGLTKNDQLFNISLELCITWINRVLFIKLLEAQLYKFHKGDKDYLFLNAKSIFDFDELSNLFFQVLAEKPGSRRQHINDKYAKIPYLNSSLFERIELERTTINISELDNRLQLPLFPGTVLKDAKGKRRTGSLPTLQYLLEFLDAYDFTSQGGEAIQEDNKNLINASVLGLIFEKINGYKDGSFFTPGYVTMHMCRDIIRQAVLQKFAKEKGWDCQSFEELYNKINDKAEANRIMNDLHVCDPAVGSGHFLVSALNELIAVKNELKILQDANGKSLRDYDVEVINDELIITDDDGRLFDYNPNNKESQRIQETLFHEKQTIIENSLFGVDINPNSVKICRLRLWIELLKNAYYTSSSNYTELETLPNIDINIKCGNSLVSRFALDTDIQNAVQHSSDRSIDAYKRAVQSYRNAENKEEKREMENFIEAIKKDFRSYISPNDAKFKQLSKLRGDLFNLSQRKELFDDGNKKVKDTKVKIERLEKDIQKLESEISEIKNNKIYENAFEWRFEFPEVLNSEGVFVGFDVVIGNPPYLTGSAFREFHNFYIQTFATAEYQLDLYPFFVELSSNLVVDNGYISMITPNSWLKNLKMQKTRRFVLEELSLQRINPNISKAFEEAQVDTLIFLAKKERAPGKLKVWTFADKVPQERHSIDQTSFLQNDGLVIDLEVNDVIRELIQKVRSKSIRLEDAFEITRGVNPYDKYRGQSEEVIKNKSYHADFPKDDSFRPELRGKHVGTFHYEWDKKHFISYGPWLAAPRDPKFFEGRRIVFREILAKRFVTTIVDENIILDRSLYIAKPFDTQTNVEAILGILSSRLLIWLFRIEKNEFDDLFPKIRLEEFKKLPIPKTNPYEAEIAAIVGEILLLKRKDKNCDITSLENELDSLIYRIYALSPNEIKIIETI